MAEGCCADRPVQVTSAVGAHLSPQARVRRTQRSPGVLGPHRVLVALPVLAVGRIGDQVVEGGGGVPVVRERAPEEDIGVAAVLRLHEVEPALCTSPGPPAPSASCAAARSRAVAVPSAAGSRPGTLPRLKVSRMRSATPQMKLTIWLWFMSRRFPGAPWPLTFRSRCVRFPRPSPCQPSDRTASSSWAMRARRSAGRARGSPRSTDTP